MAEAFGGAFGTPSAFGVAFDFPSTPPTPVQVEYGDGWIRRGSLIRWLPRPGNLQPEKAKADAVKKVAKRLKVSRRAAEDVVSAVEREVASQVNYLRAANLAHSGKRDDRYSPEDLAGMRMFWREVVRYAIELDEEEDEIVALLT